MNNNHLKRKGLIACIITVCILINLFAGGVTVQAAASPISSWTLSTQDATSGSRILGMTYTNGMFIACGDNESIGTSLDGQNWTKKFSSPSQVGFKTIAYNGNDTYVAASNKGKIAVSSNLTEWTFKDTLNSDSTVNTSEFFGVAYGNGSFIAVTIDGEIYKSDDNGTTWELKVSNSSDNFFGVTYVTYLNKFLAYGNGSVMLLSSDGETWTQASSTGSAIGYRSVAFRSDGVNNIIVAVGAGGQIRTSTDGDTWTDRVSTVIQHLNGIAYGDNGLSSIFLAVGSSGGAVLSYNGLDWTEVPGAGITTAPVVYGNNAFVTCKTNDIDVDNHPRTFLTKFNTSNITGTVKDSVTSVGISGATVSVTVGSETVSAVTDGTGSYTIYGAPSGTGRTVIANQTGYRSSAQYVDITVGSVLSLDFSLETDVIAPTLLSPSNDRIGVSTTLPIFLEFSEDIKIGANIGTELKDGEVSLATLAGAGCSLGTTLGGSEATTHIYSAYYNQTTKTLVLMANGFKANTDYYLTIKGIYDMASIALDTISLHFTTGNLTKISNGIIAGVNAPVKDTIRGTPSPTNGVTPTLAEWTAGAITWYNGGQISSGLTMVNTEYKAQFTVWPKSGYTFAGIASTGFFDESLNALNAGSITYQLIETDPIELYVIVTYPATGALTIEKAVNIGTSVPVTGTMMSDGVNQAPTGANAPEVTWSEDGSSYSSASGSYAGATTYKTKYVYSAQDGYEFDPTIATTDIIGSNIGLGKGTVASATVSQTAKANDTLTVEIEWPATQAPPAPAQSATPTVASATVTKTTATQGIVGFALTNSPALTGTWQVYTDATGTAVPAGITVSVNGSTLTLENAADMPAGTYYVAVTESGKTQSTRLAVTVADYEAPPAPTQSATPTVASATVTKTAATQGTVGFTLTNSPELTGTWQVYTATTGTAVPAGITVSVNGSTLTLENAADVPAGTYYVAVTESGKTQSERLALTVAAYEAPPAPTQSATPTVTLATVTKTAATQGIVNFTLTNSPALTGTWQVYTDATGTAVPAGITVLVNGPTLTLENAADVPAGTYYVAVTESGKTQSTRLAVTVANYEAPPIPSQSATPTVASATVTKTAATQGTVNFTLTNSPALTGTWQVYTAATGTDVPTGITASFNGSTLTLENVADVPAGTYYVAVTESVRLALTVVAYEAPPTPAQSATPTVASATVTKTAATQGTVNFTLTNSPAFTGTWQVYTAATGTSTPAGITVSVNGSTLTLENAADVPAGTYYVAVTESGKTESTRLALTVAAYVAQPNGNAGGTSSGNGAGVSVNTQTPKSSVITIDTKPDSSGKVATTSVTESQITSAVNQAIEEAVKKGQGKAAEVEIKVNALGDVKTVETSILKAAVQALAGSNADILTVSTPIAKITFDSKSIDTISREAVGDVKIIAAKVDSETLSTEIKQVIGSRPVFDFSVVSGNKTISQFGGIVTVSLPYTPQPGEDNNAIVIYYINDEGKPEIVSNCVYDSVTGMISFTTNHFSQYAVGYNKVSFSDVSKDAWYSQAVSFVAARAITTGTGEGKFSPGERLTRAQFLVMMMKAYGISPDESPIDNFADAGSTYYTNYLATAKRLGITEGTGGNLFAPNKVIPRQEMVTLLYNSLKIMGKLPQGTSGVTLSSFSDAMDTASWAKDAMALMVETGTIGGNDGKILPASTTTRAEMAQILYNLLSK